MTSAEWVAILAAASTLVGALAAAIVAVINALRGVNDKLLQHETASEQRFRSSQLLLKDVAQKAGAATDKLSLSGTPADTGPGRL